MEKIKKFLVGGAVRDKLLGIEPKDNDYVVVGSSPQEMLSKGFKQVGKQFPVFLHPTTKEEYALARKEIKSGPGHKGFQFDFSPQITLKDDLVRRDLTINAIAMDDDGNIIAPHSGVEDLSKKILRHVSDHFREDPLRVLRVARFQAQLPQFSLAPETLKLLQDMQRELNTLSPERVFIELKKALLCPAPQLFFQTLKICGALPIILPELDALQNISQSKKYHPEGDVWTHTMLVLEEAAKMSPELDVRFAALVHDLGKANTPKDMLPKHFGHEERGVTIIENLGARIPLPNQLKQLAAIVARYHFQAHQACKLPSNELLELLRKTHALKTDTTTFEKFLTCCIADNRGKKSDKYPQAQFLSQCADTLKAIDTKPITKKIILPLRRFRLLKEIL